MTRKSEQIQIRVTPHQKAALKRRAKHAGQDVSSYVLSRTLPPPVEPVSKRSYARSELSRHTVSRWRS